MKKVLILAAIMMSTSAYADSRLTGDWCQIYDDFTEILSIKDDGSLTTQRVGNEALEQSKNYLSEGYISTPGGGSGGAFMVENGVKNKISYSVEKEGIIFVKTTLTIESDSDGVEVYQKCSVKRKSDVEEETVTEENY